MTFDRSTTSAADYADALIVARRAKNTLCLILLVILIAQIVIYFCGRYRVDLGAAKFGNDMLHYWIGLAQFAGIVAALVLAADLLLITLIMIVGRVVGVAHLVNAFLWCILLAAILFPWQAFLINATFTSDAFKIPGALCTWNELVLRCREQPAHFSSAWLLMWARFIAWPLAAVAITVWIGIATRIGLGSAIRRLPVEKRAVESPVTSADKRG